MRNYRDRLFALDLNNRFDLIDPIRFDETISCKGAYLNARIYCLKTHMPNLAQKSVYTLDDYFDYVDFTLTH